MTSVYATAMPSASMNPVVVEVNGSFVNLSMTFPSMPGKVYQETGWYCPVSPVTAGDGTWGDAPAELSLKEASALIRAGCDAQRDYNDEMRCSLPDCRRCLK